MCVYMYIYIYIHTYLYTQQYECRLYHVKKYTYNIIQWIYGNMVGTGYVFVGSHGGLQAGEKKTLLGWI